MIAAALLALATQAAAPTAIAPVPQQDIVVTGRNVTAVDAARRLADRVTPPMEDLQPMARFVDRVCFGTTGLPRDMGAMLIGRMAQDAVALGVPVADGKKPCSPNVLILFVDDSKAAVEQLVRRRPLLFGNMDLADIRAMTGEAGPAHAWITSEIRSRDGDRLQPGEGGGPPTLSIPSASMIRLPVRRDMIAGVVMIDRAAVPGRSIDQLAAYALLRSVTLAHARPPMAADTILTLFDPGTNPPLGLTAFDRGYVRGFYQGMATDRPSQRLATIRREVAREVLATPAD